MTDWRGGKLNHRGAPRRTEEIREKHAGRSQRVQVGNDIVHLPRCKDVSEPLHFVSAQRNDIPDPIIVGRHAALT